MKADVDNTLVRGMFRQMIDVQLKLYSVDLNVIGSLDLQPQAKVDIGSGSPPLTFKATGMGQLGGIDGPGKIFNFVLAISTLAVFNTRAIFNRRPISKILIGLRIPFLPP